MAQLNAEQNLAFMNDPRRVAAKKKMRDLVHHIHTSVKADCPNAGYYLTVLSPLLKQLNDAWEDLIVVEATVEAELLDMNRWHS